MIVCPSLLAADFLNIGKDVDFLCKNADMIHLDIMDGTFVPNISFGFPVIEAVASIATVPMDAHLMTVHPERWFARLSENNVSMVSFHLETAGENTGKYIDGIHSLGMKAGVAVNPDAPIKTLFQYAGCADFFLVMSVFAGFGGQKFIPGTLERITSLKAGLKEADSSAMIEVDGGVNSSNAVLLSAAGADILVAGSSIFKADEPVKAIEALRSADLAKS